MAAGCPRGWEVRTSRRTGEPYYVNKVSGQAQLRPPAAGYRPPGELFRRTVQRAPGAAASKREREKLRGRRGAKQPRPAEPGAALVAVATPQLTLAEEAKVARRPGHAMVPVPAHSVPGDSAAERFAGNDPGRAPEDTSYVQRAKALVLMAREDVREARGNANTQRTRHNLVRTLAQHQKAVRSRCSSRRPPPTRC